MLLVVVFGLLALVVLAIVVYQTNNGKSQAELRARAADACADYTKSKPLNPGLLGTVHNKTDAGFDWWVDGKVANSKVVIVCAGATFLRQFYGPMTYADIKEGDNVAMFGAWTDTAKTTILATLVTDVSTAQAAEFNAAVATVNPSGNSLTLSAVTMLIAGKYGPYTLNVTYDTDATKCYTTSLNKPLDCSTIAVGKRVAVTGVLYDNTLTIAARKIVVDPVKPPNVTIPPRPRK